VTPVYRILTAAQWAEAERVGALLPSALDQASGYLHLSAASELLETADRYFSEANEPVALELDPGSLGEALRWEPVATRGGALFPHVYAPQIDLEAVLAVVPLMRDGAGRHALGARVLRSTSRR
jgi:uncharacterized protein (DUF952 family)